MGKGALQPGRVDRMPVIRKIVRQGRFFVCVLCRSKWPSRDEAIVCLNDCWQEVLKLHPVVLRRQGRRSFVWRCRFCSRDYAEETKALACAEVCSERRMTRQHLDQKFLDIPLDELKRENTHIATIKQQVNKQFVSRFKLRKGIKPPEQPPAETVEADSNPDGAAEAASGEETPQTPAGDAPEAGEATPAPAEAPADSGESEELGAPPPREEKPRRHRNEFKEIFVRKDAKYECRVCLSQFFTKMEVEACFDKHFDEEGNEILAGEEGSAGGEESA